MTDPSAPKLTATHHAMLFALAAREIVQAAPDRGEGIVRQAVRRYGAQRGKRMALRAQANGDPLDMFNYMAYGEWAVGEGEMSSQMVAEGPAARSVVQRCPWHTAWADRDLMGYGRLYCLEIDEALARGFNPALRLEVRRTRPNGGEPCEFVYHGAGLTPAAKAALQRKKAALASRNIMPWEYHCGHLYQALLRHAVRELGEAGERAMERALAEFAAAYGAEAARIVAEYAQADFDRLPD